MLRANTAQKQCIVSQKNDAMSRFALEHTRLEMSHIIKTMIKIIKTKSKEGMDVETRTQFSNFADAIIRMTEEI